MSHAAAAHARLGLVLPVREYAETGEVAEVLRIGVHAERLGVDSLWIGDSLFARPRFDPLSLLAALAVRTTTATVGTAILVAPMWNPLLLARTISTVDVLSAGRLIVGVGPGPSYGPARKEFAALGISFNDRLGRLEEIIHTCRLLWSDNGPVSMSGRRWQLRDVDLYPKPFSPGGPPIWLGLRGPRGLAVTTRRGDGWLPIVRSAQDYRLGLAALRGTRAAQSPAVYLTVATSDSEASATRQLRTAVEEYYRAPWATVADLEDYCAGTPASVAAHIAAYAEAGAREIVLRFAGGDPCAQFAAIAEQIRGQRP